MSQTFYPIHRLLELIEEFQMPRYLLKRVVIFDGGNWLHSTALHFLFCFSVTDQFTYRDSRRSWDCNASAVALYYYAVGLAISHSLVNVRLNGGILYEVFCKPFPWPPVWASCKNSYTSVTVTFVSLIPPHAANILQWRKSCCVCKNFVVGVRACRQTMPADPFPAGYSSCGAW